MADLAAMEENAQAEIKDLYASTKNNAGGVRIEGGKDCPGCGSSCKPNAVLCVQCGHSFDTGKKLKTVKDSKVGKGLFSRRGGRAK